MNEHYKHLHFGMQPIEEMQLGMSSEEFCGFCKGNVFKYLRRFPYKGGKEDIEKAKRYSMWLYRYKKGEKVTTESVVYSINDLAYFNYLIDLFDIRDEVEVYG